MDMKTTLYDLDQFFNYCQIHSCICSIVKQNHHIFYREGNKILKESCNIIKHSLKHVSSLKDFCDFYKLKLVDLDILYVSISKGVKSITLEDYMQRSIFGPYEKRTIPRIIKKIENSKLIKNNMLVFENPYAENNKRRTNKKTTYNLLDLLNSKRAIKKNNKKFLIEFEISNYIRLDSLLKDIYFLDKILNVNLENVEGLELKNLNLLYNAYYKKIEKGYINIFENKKVKFSKFLKENSIEFNEFILLVKYMMQKNEFDNFQYMISQDLYSQFNDEKSLSKLIKKQLIKKEVFWYELTEKAINGLLNSNSNVSEPKNLALLEKPLLNFKDICLRKSTKRQLIGVISQYKNNDLIFNKWELGKRIGYGRGITINLFGPSGTGKTLSAKIIASYLHKKLLTINYSQIESMWVGETEKNIKEVFKIAKEEDAVLFFDEADSLTTKREYARASWEITRTNTLLKELENFEGICIFATNLWDNYDEAFNRRLSVHIEFMLPNKLDIIKIFGILLSNTKILCEDVDFTSIAQKYEGIISGGDIKNIVLNSARIAANDKKSKIVKISQKHLTEACEMVLVGKKFKITASEKYPVYIG